MTTYSRYENELGIKWVQESDQTFTVMLDNHQALLWWQFLFHGWQTYTTSVFLSEPGKYPAETQVVVYGTASQQGSEDTSSVASIHKTTRSRASACISKMQSLS